jgi:agmatine deiminase
MIPEWDGNCVFLASMLEGRHPAVFHGVREALTSHGIKVLLLGNVRDIWAVDYCPVQVAERQLVKFRYSPDYLHGHEELITGDEILEPFRGLACCFSSPIVLDGGNIVASRKMAILTDKIYKENRGWERPTLREAIRELLQVDQVIVIPHEPYDPVGHADGQLRFINENTVLINDYSRTEPLFGEGLLRRICRYGLEVELLPYFQEDRSTNGMPSAVGCYCNFIYTGKVIVAPVFGALDDEVVLKRLEAVFRNVPIVPVHCTSLAREGGVLRCIAATYQFSEADCPDGLKLGLAQEHKSESRR